MQAAACVSARYVMRALSLCMSGFWGMQHRTLDRQEKHSQQAAGDARG